MRTALLLAGMGLAGGCSLNNIYHGMYEGMRVRNQQEGTPAERVDKRDMDWNQYDKARRERLSEEQGERR